MALRSDISVAIAAVAVVLVIAAAGLVEAQGQAPPPNCAAKLTACAMFLKSDNPPATCCEPIKEAVATQLDCLCNLYAAGLSSIGVNVTDALHLTEACGVVTDLSNCNKNSSVPAPNQGSGSGNDAGKLVFTGFTSLLLLLASLILY